MFYLYCLSVSMNFKREKGKTDNRQQNRKVADYVLILILPHPTPHPFFSLLSSFWSFDATLYSYSDGVAYSDILLEIYFVFLSYPI